jgi:hypothetical protein
MNVAKRPQRLAQSKAATEILEAANFHPLQRMIAMVDEEIDVPKPGDEKFDKGVLRSMLITDYEPAPTPGKLRLRARLRMETLKELARYAYPRLKATEEARESANVGIQVVIKNYPLPSQGTLAVLPEVGDQSRQN